MPVDTVAPVMRLQINGRTVDVQAFTRFLRQLEASPWISDVQPISAQTVVQDERPVTAFSIRASGCRLDATLKVPTLKLCRPWAARLSS